MARLYFHCSSDRGALIDQSGVDLNDLSDACDHAERVVRSFIASPSMEDWRNWALHVCDGFGDDIFVVPFASAISKPH